MPPNSGPSATAAAAATVSAFSVSLSPALSATPARTALTSPAFASAAGAEIVSSAKKPVVRLYSIDSCPPNCKTLHLIRHAEGTHNVSPDSHKTPLHWDARLTDKGKQQCMRLAQKTQYHYQRRMSLDSELVDAISVEQDGVSDIHPSVGEVEAIIVSPMSRCIQTAILSFPHHYCDGSSPRVGDSSVPFIAHESWRETTNFLCDSRRPVSDLRKDFPFVDFDMISHEDDPIWSKYESIFGSHDEFDDLRESKDGAHLAQRAEEAWTWLASRPERNLAICSHSAFFMHQFQPYLTEMMGVVSYEDHNVACLMTERGFENCEIRTVAFQTAAMADGRG